MQEQFQVEFLAEFLPSKNEGGKVINIEAEKERVAIIKALERVDLNQNILIIKGLPILSEKDIDWLIEKSVSKLLYHPTRKIVPHIETFFVQPFLGLDLSTLSESSHVGGFHSDFWSAPIPPKYIMLQCIRPDPRHPYFGRNQYIKISDILETAKYIFGEHVSSKISNHCFKYKKNIPVKYHLFKNEIARFHEHLVLEEMENEINFVSAIREISLSMCTDFVLNEGEIAVINNHKGLHRRGEATIDFSNKDAINSRCLRTVRFY